MCQKLNIFGILRVQCFDEQTLGQKTMEKTEASGTPHSCLEDLGLRQLDSDFHEERSNFIVLNTKAIAK